MRRREPDDLADLEIRIEGRAGESAPYPVRIRCLGDVEGELSPAIGGFVADLLVDPKRSGDELFRLLLSDPKLAQKWSEVRSRASRRRIRLDIAAEAAELHAVPWELLRQPVRGYVSADSSTPFSRYLPFPPSSSEPIAEAPLRVLVAIVAPSPGSPLPPIDVAQERAALEKAFRKAPRRTIEATFLPEGDGPVDLAAVEEAIRRVRPHVLHIVAHGVDDDSGRFLCFEHADGSPDLADAEKIRELFSRLDPQPRLVFLAACQSAADGTAALRGLAPAFAEAGVSAVVAMQDRVPAKLARDLAAKFYDRLCHHGLVDVAINEARSLLLTGKQRGAAIPVLFQTLKDGRLLERSGPVERTPWDHVFGDLADRLPVRGGRAWVGNFRSRLLLALLGVAGAAALGLGSYLALRGRPMALNERLGRLALERAETHLDNALLLALEREHRLEAEAPSALLLQLVERSSHIERFRTISRADDAPSLRAASPNGKTVATVEDGGRVVLRDIAAGRTLYAFEPGRRVAALAWSGDGNRFAAALVDGRIWVLAWKQGVFSERTLSQAETPLSLALGRNGNPLIVGTEEGSLWFWDPDRGRLTAGPIDCYQAPARLALSPDGSLLAIAYEDSSVVTWETARQRLAQPERLTGWSGPISDLMWKDNRTLAVGLPDLEVTVLARRADRRSLAKAGRQALEDAACSRANRNLTENEWEEFRVDPAPSSLRCQCPRLPDCPKR